MLVPHFEAPCICIKYMKANKTTLKTATVGRTDKELLILICLYLIATILRSLQNLIGGNPGDGAPASSPTSGELPASPRTSTALDLTPYLKYRNWSQNMFVRLKINPVVDLFPMIVLKIQYSGEQ